MKLDIDYLSKYSFALYQNDCSLIKSIIIKNDSGNKLSNLALAISSEPEFFHNFSYKIDEIESEKELQIKLPAMKLNFSYLNKLKEKLKGNFEIKISSEENKLLSEVYELSIFPKNYWNGINPVPEIIAAYVEPNNDEVIKILKVASKKLKNETGNSAINGYQSNSKERVWQICAAIYNSIHDLHITYSNPPASFEESGQKIRTPNEIIKTKFATCLDVTLLYSACIEQAGLNPLIFFQKNHAFAGVWLEEIFTEKTIESDLTFFNKCLKTNDLIAIETTLLTSDEDVTFDSAAKYAEKYMSEAENFILAVDITGSRVVSKIRPISTAESDSIVDDKCLTETKLNIISKKTFIDYQANKIKQKQRIDIWKSRLLDLSFRNRFINYKETQQTIKILCPNPAELEDELNNDKTYKINEKPQLNISQIRDNESYESRTKNNFDSDILKADLKKQILHTPYTENETNKRLLNLFRKQKLSEEESGTNTLFLSIGLLEWKETEKSQTLIKSPLLLVPVELKRKSIIDGFRLQLRDDEPIINFTLLEKLENDFGIKIPGLNPLPEDDSGVDVPQIWYLFRKEIKNKADWDVLEEVWLGHFSFKKFLMWKDLHENEKSLSRNPLVKRILFGENNDKAIGNIPLTPENEVDKVHPSELILPLSADSSQIAAILSTQKGKNLIIQGPPGTGKSQTITNLIANTISAGKTVLFVSEKKVALEVVFKRLKEIMLEPFCLELHSNKSQKGEVIQSFKKSLDFRIQDNENKWDDISNNLHNKKLHLNQYINELHSKKHRGISVFDSFGIHSQLLNTDKVKINLSDPQAISKEQYETALAKIKSIENYCNELNIDNGFAFKDCKISEFDFDLPDQINSIIKILIEKITNISQITHSFKSKININNLSDLSLGKIYQLNNLFQQLVDAPQTPGNFIEIPQWNAVKNELLEFIELKKSLESNVNDFTKKCSSEFLEQDFLSLNSRLKHSENSWVLKKYFLNRKIIRELRIFFLNPLNISINDISESIELGVTIDTLSKQVLDYGSVAKKIFGVSWSKHNSLELDQILQKIINIKKCTKLVKESLKINSLSSDLKSLLDNEDLIDENSELINNFKEIGESIILIKSNIKNIENCLLTDFSNFETIYDIQKTLEKFSSSLSDLRNWCSIQKEAEYIRSNGFGSLLDSLFNNQFSVSKLVEIFIYNFNHIWLKSNLNKSEMLKFFSSINHNNIVTEFQELDKKHQEASVIKMIDNLLKTKPINSKMIALSSPISIINKESLKKRKQKSIRNFIDSIEPIMSTLKPCMLMSPLSVAQYLPAKQMFDLVIFDEASQITPWDAIGAIGRGKQVVVVGDSKQLPPTNIFSKSINEEFLDEEYEDLESILDECQKHLDAITLRWHYRSKYESLIAFSNRHIYDNKLNTFPSSNIQDKAVSFRFIPDGIYDRGRSRTNIIEAKAIVGRIIDLFRQDIFSIGVITFNQSQCNKIEDLLFTEIRKHPELDKKMSSHHSDSIFIKNIENVQGDERDIILFSMTFGFDEKGVLTQRFSSLNSVGGHRRLNVAITRARQQIIVFSSIKMENIDIKKAKFMGVKLLREFLNYAEKGAKVSFMEEIDEVNEEDFDSPFEQEVFNELTNLGWKVLTQIGVGNYRIDLGIIHPENPGMFLAGIECDGRTYHSSKSARDRDILRQTVLENMGWKILRIWSTDWFYDKNKTISRINDELKNLLSQLIKPIKNDAKKTVFNKLVNLENISEDAVSELGEEFSLYSEKILPESYNPDDFYLVGNKSKIINQIESIIWVESPISSDALFKKVYKSWGLTRGGSKVNRILQRYTTNLKSTISNKRTFFWCKTQNPQEIFKLRISPNNNRYPKDICPQELAFGLLLTLEHNHSIKRDELFKKVHEILGWKKRTKSSDAYYDEALEFLIKSNKAIINDEVVSLK